MNKNKIILTIEIMADADYSKEIAKAMLKDLYENLTICIKEAGLSEKMKLTKLVGEVHELENKETPGKNSQYVN